MKRVFRGSHQEIKRVVLLFVGGFFFGVLFFWLFKNSFFYDLHEMNGSVQKESGNEVPFWSSFFFVVLSHTKSFGALWLIGMTKLRIPYIMLFTLYKGFSIGFLYSFFIMEYGISAIRFCLYYMFPQGVLLIPIFLLSMQNIYRRNENHMLLTVLGMYLILLLACALEVRFNIPLMNSLYTT